MKLYFGGAYNGKLELVKNKYKIKDSEVFNCDSNKIDFDKKVINNFHEFVFNTIKDSKDPKEYVLKNLDKFRGKIIISDDLNSGIVPIEILERRLREDLGEILKTFSKESKEVYRVFFGIESKLKGDLKWYFIL